VDQSDNATVMEGMSATLFCKFESDLGFHVNWVRPSKKALLNQMAGFDPNDPASFEIITGPDSYDPVIGEAFLIKQTKLSDSGRTLDHNIGFQEEKKNKKKIFAPKTGDTAKYV
jgi:hypothetical protein